MERTCAVVRRNSASYFFATKRPRTFCSLVAQPAVAAAPYILKRPPALSVSPCSGAPLAAARRDRRATLFSGSLPSNSCRHSAADGHRPGAPLAAVSESAKVAPRITLLDRVLSSTATDPTVPDNLPGAHSGVLRLSSVKAETASKAKDCRTEASGRKPLGQETRAANEIHVNNSWRIPESGKDVRNSGSSANDRHDARRSKKLKKKGTGEEKTFVNTRFKERKPPKWMTEDEKRIFSLQLDPLRYLKRYARQDNLRLDGESDARKLVHHFLMNKQPHLAYVEFDISSRHNHPTLGITELGYLLRALARIVKSEVGGVENSSTIEKGRRVWKDLRAMYANSAPVAEDAGGGNSADWAGPDSKWFASIVAIENAADNVEAVRKLWADYRRDYKPGVVTAWNAVMLGLARSRKASKEVVEMYRDMCTEGVQPDAMTFDALSSATVQVHEEMLRRTATEAQAMEGASVEQDRPAQEPADSLDLINAIELLVADAERCNVGNLSPLFRRVMMEMLPFDRQLVIRLHDYALFRGMKPSTDTCNVVIRAHLKAGDPDAARKFAEEEMFGRFGLMADVVTVNLLLKAAAQRAANLEEYALARDSLRERFPDVRWTAESHNIGILALLKDYPDDVEGVREAMDIMSSDGVTPTVVTYAHLIEALIAAGQLAQFPSVVRQMRHQGLTPPMTSLFTVFRENLRTGNIDGAIEAFRATSDSLNKFSYKMFADMLEFVEASAVAPNKVLADGVTEVDNVDSGTATVGREEDEAEDEAIGHYVNATVVDPNDPDVREARENFVIRMIRGGMPRETINKYIASYRVDQTFY